MSDLLSAIPKPTCSKIDLIIEILSELILKLPDEAEVFNDIATIVDNLNSLRTDNYRLRLIVHALRKENEKIINKVL